MRKGRSTGGGRRARSLLWRSLAASAITLALLAAASPADVAIDELTVSGTLETPVHLTDKTRSILYYLQLHSGSGAERFAVQLTPPRFATKGGLPEGQSIDGPVDIALQGPGTIGDTVEQPSTIVPCSSNTAAFHGYATGIASVDLLLPPDANTVLAVRYDTGRSAPWIDSDFRLEFTIEPFLVGTYPASSPFAAGPTVSTASSYTTSGPTIHGAIGAHILLNTSPRQVGGDPYAAKTVGAGTRIEVSGLLLPAASGRQIVLQWSRGAGALHTLAKVTTGPGGRFGAASWRLGSPGTYELWARYPAQPGGLLADSTSCPLSFQVG